MGTVMDEVGRTPVRVAFADVSRWSPRYLDLSQLPGNKMPTTEAELFDLTREALVTACQAKGKDAHKVRHLPASLYAYRKTAVSLILLAPAVTFDGAPCLPPEYNPN